MVFCKDRDLRKCISFLISVVTVIEELLNELIDDSQSMPDFSWYMRKLQRYNPTVKVILRDFEDEVFGFNYNKVVRDTFVERLAGLGWKYFSRKNLNEYFALMYREYGSDAQWSDG